MNALLVIVSTLAGLAFLAGVSLVVVNEQSRDYRRSVLTGKFRVGHKTSRPHRNFWRIGTRRYHVSLPKRLNGTSASIRIGSMVYYASIIHNPKESP